MSDVLMGNWVNNTALYPPAHIYAGMSQSKVEKNAIRICEELYRFNFGDSPNVLGELRSAFRELCVMTHVENQHPTHMKLREEHVAEVKGTFMYWALNAVREMDRVFKQHQDLWKWYNNFKLKKSEIVDWVYYGTNKEQRDAFADYHDRLKKKYERTGTEEFH